AHIFNILWITVIGFGAMWWLKLSLADVFGFGKKDEDEPAEEAMAGDGRAAVAVQTAPRESQ
ncbi:MAG TPA: hypothetical protein VIE40_06130, partial [Dehalococcoidia bacterium]